MTKKKKKDKYMEAETEMREIHLKCPDCEMDMRPNAWYYSDAWFRGKDIEYKCCNCGITKISDKKYPYLKYVPK